MTGVTDAGNNNIHGQELLLPVTMHVIMRPANMSLWFCLMICGGDVNIHGQEKIRLATGDVFGEQSKLKETTANADVVTDTACRLAKFTRAVAQDLIASDKAFAKIFETIVNTQSRR